MPPAALSPAEEELALFSGHWAPPSKPTPSALRASDAVDIVAPVLLLLKLG